MASDKLVRISQNNWGTLRDLYLINWPTNMIGYYTIDNYMRWTEKLSAIENLFLYSLNGEWTSDGTFALSVCYNFKVNKNKKQIFDGKTFQGWQLPLYKHFGRIEREFNMFASTT